MQVEALPRDTERYEMKLDFGSNCIMFESNPSGCLEDEMEGGRVGGREREREKGYPLL